MALIMDSQHIDTIFLRNPPFVSEETQRRLSEIHIGIIGCGLSSQIALALTRIGVRKFSLWDYDTVEPSNMNRQVFLAEHRGVNKASATADILKRLHPSIVTEIHESRFSKQELETGLINLDIVLNTIHFNDPMHYDVGEFMQAKNKWCIHPLNLGLGGFSLTLSPTSPSLETMTNGRQLSASGFANILKSCSGIKLSENLMHIAPDLLSAGDRQGWFPQNIIATSITSALVTYSVVKIAEGAGEEIAAPRALHFEPF